MATHYANPAGTPQGAGTVTNPADLQTLLNGTGIANGDVIRLQDGTYVGHFTGKITGSDPNAKVTVMQDSLGLPGKATLDGNTGVQPANGSADTAVLTLDQTLCRNVRFVGFRVTNTDPLRGTTPDGTAKVNGIFAQADNCDLIHLMVDNHGENCVADFQSARGSPLRYGLVLFNSGNVGGFNKNSGYCVYAHHDALDGGAKLYQACVAWGSNFSTIGSYLFHLFTQAGGLVNMQVLDNILVASPSYGNPNGVFVEGDTWRIPLLLGGGAAVTGGLVQRNLSLKPFTTRLYGGAVNIGEAYPDNLDVQLLDNHFIGGAQVSQFRSAVLQRNTMVAASRDNIDPGQTADRAWTVGKHTAAPVTDPNAYTWGGSGNANTYYNNNKRETGAIGQLNVFNINGEGMFTLAGWQTRVAGDVGAQQLVGVPVAAYVKANWSPYSGYNGFFATIGVANYAGLAAVPLDPTGHLPVGTPYEIWDVRDLGVPNTTPVASGLWQSGTILLPMSNTKAPQTMIGTGAQAPLYPQAAWTKDIAAFVMVVSLSATDPRGGNFYDIPRGRIRYEDLTADEKTALGLVDAPPRAHYTVRVN